jgi:hypothetical protein
LTVSGAVAIDHSGVIMKNFCKKTGAMAILIVFGFLQIGITIAADRDPGTLEILKDGKTICVLPIEAGTVNLFKKEKGCHTDIYVEPSIKLHNVRSGTYITLSTFRDMNPDPSKPNYGCHNYGNYMVELKTIKDNVTYPPQGTGSSLAIFDLQKLDTGKPVVPGLLLTQKAFIHEFRTSISCVRIDFR